MALSIEEKYDEVRQLITMGKEKGYLLYEEVNDMLPSEISSSDELDDIFSMFGSMGIEVVDSEQKYPGEGGGRRRARSWTSPRAPWTRPTTPSACTCARWAPFPCSPARARSRSPSASSAARRRCCGSSPARPWPPGGGALGGAPGRPRDHACATWSSSTRKRSPRRSSRPRSARRSSSWTRSRRPTTSTSPTARSS